MDERVHQQFFERQGLEGTYVLRHRPFEAKRGVEFGECFPCLLEDREDAAAEDLLAGRPPDDDDGHALLPEQPERGLGWPERAVPLDGEVQAEQGPLVVGFGLRIAQIEPPCAQPQLRFGLGPVELVEVAVGGSKFGRWERFVWGDLLRSRAPADAVVEDAQGLVEAWYVDKEEVAVDAVAEFADEGVEGAVGMPAPVDAMPVQVVDVGRLDEQVVHDRPLGPSVANDDQWMVSQQR